MKSSSMSRALELAKLAAKVGLKELKSGDVQSRIDQAILITKSLSQLKGAAMKAGQLLSLDLDNYFPPEAIQILSQLQNAAVAHSFDEIDKILLAELGSETRSQIKRIDRFPLGVASIGQVHKAEFQGKAVALKVQYAEVGSSIDADLKILRTLAQSFCQITGRKMNLEPLFAEFKSLLQQELDYGVEASNLKIFKEKILSLNENSSLQYRVPSIVDELCTSRVLGMSFESGVTLRQWISERPSVAQKEQIAVGILDLYFHEFFEWGLVQTDPNWGNFLVDQKNTELELCLLDFGATRKYSSDFVRRYIKLLELASTGKSEELKGWAIEFGLLDSRESAEAFKAFERMLKTAIKPFFVGSSGASHFDFSDQQHSLDSQLAAKALSEELVYSPPPYSIVFLHRKLAGVYSILKSLEVKLDISPYWQMMNDLAIREVRSDQT